jgi:glycogen synthase
VGERGTYTLQVVAAKPLLKEALQAEVGLPVNPTVPLFGFIGRLEEQKGSDILAEATSDFLKEDMQLIVLVMCPSLLYSILLLLSKTFLCCNRAVPQNL